MFLVDGKRFHILKPSTRKINIENIAHGLSLICRFGGQVHQFYSVAEHCINVAKLVDDRLKLAALLHDATENYVGDVILPLKKIIRDVYKPIENRIDKVICSKFGIKLSKLDHLVIKNADNTMAATEMRDLITLPKTFKLPFKPLKSRISQTMTPEQAEKAFLKEFDKLYG